MELQKVYSLWINEQKNRFLHRLLHQRLYSWAIQLYSCTIQVTTVQSDLPQKIINCKEYNKTILQGRKVVVTANTKSCKQSWATNWQMSFNATKCKLLSITNKTPSEFAYSPGSETLSPTDEHDYLDVWCRRNLHWSTNCTTICNRAIRGSAYSGELSSLVTNQ